MGLVFLLPIDNLKRVLFTFCDWIALPCGAMFSRQLSAVRLEGFTLGRLFKRRGGNL